MIPMFAPSDDYSVVYVASPTTDLDETVTALQSSGELAVDTARSISEGRQRLETGGVDCVVSDYDLSDGDGLSLLETVREEYGSVPFVLYPEDGSEMIATRAFRNGVTEYVPRDTETSHHTELRDRVLTAVEGDDTTEELRDLRQFKQGLFESNLAIHIMDADGTLLDVNEAAEEICGYAAAELGDGRWDLLYPDEEYRAEVLSTVEGILESNQGQEFETTLTTKQGEDRTVSWYVQPLTDEHGSVDGLVAVGRDVTERRARERELEELTTRLQLALEETDTGVWEWDLQTDEVFLDEACQQLFGYEPGAFPGEYEAFARRVHDEDLPAVEQAVEQAIESDTQYQADFRIELPDGEQRWLQSRGIVEYDDEGEPNRMFGVETDITDRKAAERAVEETNEYYERIFERSSDYVVIADEEGIVTDVTQGITHVLGYDPEEVIGTESLSYVHPDDRDRVADVVADVIENPELELDTEYRIRTADGSYQWVEARGTNHLDDPLIDGLVANIRDISDRKAAEQTAEETKQYYDRIFQQSSDYVLIVDQEGRIKNVTQGIDRVLGYEPDEMIDTDAFGYVHPDDRPRVADAMAEVIENPETEIHIEYRSETSDGSYRWVEARGTNHLDDDFLDGLVATVRDISERKEREQELESLTTRFELALEETNSGLWEWTPSREEIMLDDACQQLFGYEPGEFSGAAAEFRDHVHDDDLPAVEEAIDEAVANDSLYQADFRIELPNGEQRWIQSRGIVEYDDEGDLDRMLGIKTDITERKRAERAVEETKQYYRRIFEKSPDYTLVVDESGVITDVTRGVEQVSGYSPDEIIGQNAFDAVHPEDADRVRELFDEAVANGEASIDTEYRVRIRDGSYLWIEARGDSHLDDPLLEGIVVNVRDISQRKERQQQLEELTTRLELALEETDTGVWEWNLETDEVFWDEASERLFGYESGTFPGTWEGFAQCVLDDDLRAVEAAATEAIETDQRYQVDFRIELPDGEQRWIQGRGIVKYDEDGEPDRMVGIHTDITDRKEAQQAVEETKEYYQRLFEQSSDFVLVVDEEATILDVTQGVEHVMGHDPDEVIGSDALSNVHPEDRDRIISIMKDVIENPETAIDFEYRSQASDGSYRWLEARGSNHLDDPLLNGLVANIRDISQRKERQQQLEELTTRLELALEETDTGVWEWNLRTDEVFWDEACERLFGYEPGEFPETYEGFARRVPDDDLAEVEEAVSEAIDTGEQYRADFRIELPDGEQRWIQSRGLVEYTADGEPDRMLGVQTDITDLKEAQRAVEETKERYQRLFAFSPDYVTITDEEGTLTDVTPGIQHVLGYEPDAVIGMDAFSLIHPEDRERIQDVLADAVGNPTMEIDIQYRAQTTDGDYRWMEARGNNHLDDPLLAGVVVNVRDITERKEREQQLARLTRQLKQKNKQLERLAQVVSHDLQTPLSTAEKLTQLLRGDLGETDPEIEQSLTDLEATHQRLREFADHLPRLARESTDIEEPTECELRTVAEAAWAVVDTGPLELRVDSSRTLSADPERLQRLFENFFQNTVTHGVRTVETTGDESASETDVPTSSAGDPADGRETPTATTVSVGSFSDGFFVADDGPGIRPEQQDEIFEYGMGTTSGSGFGLAIARTIVEAHGWEIEVADGEPQGVRFEIYTTR